jgi:lipid II:glycine glycyltransferase (peptidoglycan interpeptide bridge formation enzyme)
MKMDSDKLLAVYKNEVINANNIFSTYPHGVVIATSAVIKYAREIFFLIDGYNNKFKSFSANHLMKWAIINEFAKKGYLYAHHNGITGVFDNTNPYYGLYEFKKGFNSDVVEYIGEFDMIINTQAYSTYQHIKFFQGLFEFKK